MGNNKNTIATPKQSFSTFMALPAVRDKVKDIVVGKDGDRFITSIVTAVGTNPQLAACDYSSILSAALLGEALKLSPSPQLGQFYMVPYNDNNRKIKVAQFQLGYKGYIQLAIRSGQYRDIDVISVKEGELISYDPFRQKGEFKAVTDPIEREKAETIGYYAYFELLNGFRKEMYWSKEQMLAHAKQYSQGYASDLRKGTSYTFWAKNFDGMAQKTMLRQLISKWGLMSIEMQQAFSGDMGTIRDDGSVDYIDHADDAIFKDVTPIEEDTPKLEESEPMTIPDPDDVAPLPFDMGDQQSIEQMFFG
jgi:recombination protein RecT